MTGGGLVLSISALACARRGLNLPPVQRGSQVTCFLLGLALPELGLATDLSSLQLRDPPVGPWPGRVPRRRRVLNIKIRMRPAPYHCHLQHQRSNQAAERPSYNTTPWPRLVDNACLHLAVVQNKKFAKIPNELVATMQFKYKYYWLGVDIVAQFSRITTPYYLLLPNKSNMQDSLSPKEATFSQCQARIRRSNSQDV